MYFHHILNRKLRNTGASFLKEIHNSQKDGFSKALISSLRPTAIPQHLPGLSDGACYDFGYVSSAWFGRAGA